jgi:signal transduction histidine kinase
VAQDITEAHQHEEALVLANRQKSQFLAMLAHQLRNPLAAVELSAQVLQSHYDRDGPESHLWAVLERQVAHLTHLVHGALDVGRYDQGKVVLHKTPTTLATVLQQAMDIARPMAD